MEERELIRNAKEGHPDAFERLVRLYEKRAFAFVYASVRNREDARDIVQDVFMNLYTHIRRIDENRKFFSYFYKTVRNHVMSHYRSRSRSKSVRLEDLPDVIRDWSHPGLGTEDKVFLLNALDSLGEQDRNLMILRYFGGLNDAELSETTGLSEDNIRVKIHRSKKKILGMLGGGL